MKFTLSTLALTMALTGAASAQELPAEAKARQGQFRILAINLGILGGMAKGEIEYSAEAAQASADSIHAVTMIHQEPLWKDGTDTMSIDGTRALPVIWEKFDDFKSKWADLGTAAEEATQVVANGQEAIGPALGKLGDACKACHDTYREPQ